MLLSEARVRVRGIVSDLKCKDSVKRRLMDIGLIKGVEIEVKGIAPLGDPILIYLRGFSLAIRNADAKYIILKQI